MNNQISLPARIGKLEQERDALKAEVERLRTVRDAAKEFQESFGQSPEKGRALDAALAACGECVSDAKQPCSHPVACIVQAKEGTAYCEWCADLSKLKQLEQECVALRKVKDAATTWDALVWSEGSGPSEKQVEEAERLLHESLEELAAQRNGQPVRDPEQIVRFLQSQIQWLESNLCERHKNVHLMSSGPCPVCERDALRKVRDVAKEIAKNCDRFGIPYIALDAALAACEPAKETSKERK